MTTNQGTSVEDIQSKIDQWKELTSNLESIKEQMFGETSSTHFQNTRKSAQNTKENRSPKAPYNQSTPSSDIDAINPLESQPNGDYIIDLSTKMKAPERVTEFPDSHFTPIKEDEESENECSDGYSDSQEISSFPSSF